MCAGGDIAQLVEHRTGTPSMQIRFPGVARVLFLFCFFSLPKPIFIPCKLACIYVCAHVKDSAVHVRVRWIMETLKHPACTVARFCRSLLSPGKTTRISYGRNPIGTIQLSKVKVKVKRNYSCTPPGETTKKRKEEEEEGLQQW